MNAFIQQLRARVGQAAGGAADRRGPIAAAGARRQMVVDRTRASGVEGVAHEGGQLVIGRMACHVSLTGAWVGELGTSDPFMT